MTEKTLMHIYAEGLRQQAQLFDDLEPSPDEPTSPDTLQVRPARDPKPDEPDVHADDSA